MKKKGLGLVLVVLCISALLFANGAKETSTAGSVTTKDNSVEIFSWWTAGGEAEGLQAMINVFNAKNPGVKLLMQLLLEALVQMPRLFLQLVCRVVIHQIHFRSMQAMN